MLKRILLVAVITSMELLSPMMTTASALTPCTVTGPVSPTYRDAWASAYRCKKTSAGLGDATGISSDWYGYASEISPQCTGVTCSVVKLDFSTSVELYDDYVAEGDDQLGAFLRPDDAYGVGTFGAYWYYRRPGLPLYTRRARYDCNGADRGGANDVYVGASTPYWRQTVRREFYSENPDVANPTWRIYWDWINPSTGAVTCTMRVTSIEGMGYRTAEQWVNNDHGTLPGSTRHRVRVNGLKYLDLNGYWQPWADGQTGNSYGGYATSGKVASDVHCLRTGNLGPTCP